MTAWRQSAWPSQRRCLLGYFALTGLLLAGCHSDTQAGGGAEMGKKTDAVPHTATPSRGQAVPVPPTADQVDPSSPSAVLDGTSTTRPSMPAAGSRSGSRPAGLAPR